MPKLTYFNIRARAETARLVLELAGASYENDFVDFQTWPTLKANYPYKQIPVYSDEDLGDTVLAQSNTIARYLAEKHGNGFVRVCKFLI